MHIYSFDALGFETYIARLHVYLLLLLSTRTRTHTHSSSQNCAYLFNVSFNSVSLIMGIFGIGINNLVNYTSKIKPYMEYID